MAYNRESRFENTQGQTLIRARKKSTVLGQAEADGDKSNYHGKYVFCLLGRFDKHQPAAASYDAR